MLTKWHSVKELYTLFLTNKCTRWNYYILLQVDHFRREFSQNYFKYFDTHYNIPSSIGGFLIGPDPCHAFHKFLQTFWSLLEMYAYFSLNKLTRSSINLRNPQTEGIKFLSTKVPLKAIKNAFYCILYNIVAGFHYYPFSLIAHWTIEWENYWSKQKPGFLSSVKKVARVGWATGAHLT